MRLFIRIAVLWILLLPAKNAFCQCTEPGAYPGTAIELCSMNPIHHSAMAFCNGGDLGNGLLCPESMPLNRKVWYKFNCYQSGYLFFSILPEQDDEDLDWAIFDITGGFIPDDIFHNPRLAYDFNWSWITGETGTPLSGGRPHMCKSVPPKQTLPYSPRPYLQLGHKYLFVVVNSSNTDDGFTLSWNHPVFNATTAVIVNPVLPKLQGAETACGGEQVRVWTNREMQCNSLAADISDFTITDATGNIFSANTVSSRQCNYQSSFDSLRLFFNPVLPAGNYVLTIKNGTDGNTLLDNCGHPLAVGEHINFTVDPVIIPQLDSIAKIECLPNIISLVFKRPVSCSSIDVNGGEFFVTGPSSITVHIAEPDCNRYGESVRINLFFFDHITTGGDYYLHLQKGPDNNTILDECGNEIPLPAQILFHIPDTVNANFQYSVDYSCTKNTVIYNHDGAHDVLTWRWAFDAAPFQSNTQHQLVQYTNFEDKLTSLYVSNGACEDSVTQRIVFANYMKAGFQVSDDVCPEEKAAFINTTISNSPITNWQWEPGNGNIINTKDPGPQSFVPVIAADYTAHPKLTVTNSFGCTQSVTGMIEVHNTCFVAVPGAFTPNGDGLNDYLYPLKAFRSNDMTFNVYNHYGQLVFHGSNRLYKWDGKIKGVPQETGAYVWILKYTDTKTGEQVFKKGSSLLLR